ncbi:hypothetical protein ACQPVP_15375 [Clostridium nigeriense]|uniref:hypothetical protein n=1 Tax=Clostridium nigeriense TaxID=1805470 RepID=UPI003D324B41
MEREKVKELIKGYKENGFPYVDIELKDERFFQISFKVDNYKFGSQFLKIRNKDLLIYIRYSSIKTIAI